MRELGASGQFPRELLEFGSDVFFRADLQLRLQYVSPNVERVLGWRPEELIGHALDEYVERDDRPAEAAAWFNEHRIMSLRGLVRRNDGTRLWFENRMLGVFDEHGLLAGFIGVFRDIDRQVVAEEQLRESEQQYRMLAEHASDVVVQLDNAGVVRWLSLSAQEILGTAPADLIGRSVLEIVHPDDLPVVRSAQAAALRGEVSRLQARYRHGDGTYVWMSVVGSSLFDDEGRVVGRVASARNIDTERAALDALATSEEQFRLLVENAQDMVVRTLDGEPVFVSPGVERMLGWTPEELMAEPVASLFHPDDLDKVPDIARRVKDGPVTDVRLRVRHKDGSYRWVEVTTRSVRGDDNHANNVTVVRDVTDRIAAEQALAAATAQAQAASMAKTAFLSRMSHELRTPLNAVLGFAQLLGMESLTDDQQSSVEQILNGGRHLLELINEVLDIARIESGRMTLSPETVSAADVIAECLDLVRPLALQHDVIVERFDVEASTDQLFVDRQRTIQILINLASNAIKYNRVGGRVRVKCERTTDRPDAVAIAVCDDGIGIAAVDLPKLFAPFERLGAASTGVEGTGIGLALSRGLAEMMGGTVTVESELGVGSTFRLVLPRADGAQATAAVPVPSVTGTSSAHRRVLYLEDNPANALLMRSIVGRRGAVDLVVVSRGAEALDMVFAAPPDLLLLDLHLPDISGEEVLRRLRTDPRTSTLPVVVITADAAPQVRQQLSALGADAFLAKPFDIGQVLSWIDDPLQGRSSR